ncbi:Hypothetical protein, putative [Bodo saltans]|uniref:Uncharacterized protein n=1 Tax=Bodo saltans TaxID=75058 RepID=A0A0S4JCI6_BODSA|nr:Hypothetical protein, putative [Bodo saltans]|eukprot:CUG89266.1 Hypothetical protein, putative [Bodo saltans]
MLRRSLFRLQLPSPSSAFNIGLQSVFNVFHVPGEPETPIKSVNKYIELHALVVAPLNKDISLFEWGKYRYNLENNKNAPLEDRNLEALCEAVAPQLDEFNRHPRLESAITQNELHYLKSMKGIDTLLDYRKKRDTIRHESRVVKRLDEYKIAIDELFAWLDPEVLDFKLRRSQDPDDADDTYAQHLSKNMPPLTHHHPYYDEEKKLKTAMLGSEYRTIADNLLKNSFPDNDLREYNPIQCLIAPPLHGKSLVLAQVVASVASYRVNKKMSLNAVAITFNGDTPLTDTETSTIDHVKCEFWGRVVYAWYLAMRSKEVPNFVVTPLIEFSDFQNKSFFRCMSFNVAKAVAQSLGLGRVLIAANELSRLTDRIELWDNANKKVAAMSTMTAMYGNRWSLLGSGFTHKNFVTIDRLTTRLTFKTILKPLTITTRSQFKLMRDFVDSKHKIFTPALRSLFEIVKNVPGYMGVWVQMLDQGEKPVRSLTDLDLPFVKSVIPELQAEPALFSGYWRAMANGNKCCDVDTASDVMTNLEKLRVIVVLPGTNNAGYGVSHRFLSPVVLAHTSLDAACEYTVIKRAIDKLACVEWTEKNKGESLECIVETSLALHATYVNDPISKAQGMTPVTLEALIKRLCGKSHIRVLATKNRVRERVDVTFPTNGLNTNVRDIKAFPSVDCRTHTDARSNLRNKAPRSERDERFQEAIEALKARDVAVLRPALSNNMGCDRTMVCRLGKTNNVALLIFETKYFTATSAMLAEIGSAKAVEKNDAEKKAIDTLVPLLDYVRYFNAPKKSLKKPKEESIKIRRVCFVYCNTAVRSDDAALTTQNTNADGNTVPCSVNGDTAAKQSKKEASELKKNPYNVDGNKFADTKCKLHTITQELAAEGCTTSLHTVWTEEEWLNLLDSFYFVVPDE